MISVKNLVFSYSQNPKALNQINDISFDVNNDEWLSIVGHNGSGKSTMAKLLVGLVSPKSGTISYDGVELTEKNLEIIRRKVGIVFQNPDNQFVGYNVRYDMAFGLENYQVPRDEMIKLIDEYSLKVDMKDYLDREPETLSGGQKQRVALAGILALDCDVIILDEATSMLDPKGTKEVIDLITELHTKYHKTIITITHDLNFAMKSDRVLVFKNGKVTASGAPMEVFKNRSVLLESNLDMPFGLKAYSEMSKIDSLNQNKELMEVVWNYHLNK